MPSAATTRLQKLNSITGLGLYKNFFWDSEQLPDFDRYNLIYGHNYSGKTTLSRVFQSIENRGMHPDFAGATFSFTRGDGNVISSSFAEPLPQVRVFNKEFVFRNFNEGADMTGAGLIAVIGETNQELKIRQESLNGRIDKVTNFKTKLEGQKRAIETRLNAEATAQARIILQIVGGPYTRTHLLNTTIPLLPKNYLPLPLSEPELEAEKEQFRRAGDFEKIGLYQPNHSLFFINLFKLRSTLKEVATNNAIETLRQNTGLERWVETGIELNNAGERCGFCGAAVTDQRWTELKGHFSEAFSNLQNTLKGLKDDLNELVFEAPAINETSLSPELRDKYNNARAEVISLMSPASDYIQEIIGYIDRKIQSIESAITWIPNAVVAKALRSAIHSLNQVIEEHNAKVLGSDGVRSSSKSKICQHFAIDYLKRNNVLQAKYKTKTIEDRIAKCLATLRVIQGQRTEIKIQIEEASIAAQMVNRNLNLLLPEDDIVAVKLNETDFEFQRAGRVARNMSDGEKTAVAFSYFLAKLEEGPAPLQETIVVLDDPISSLDENHIYAVHSICENRLSKAHQLFVLTHNSSFFGLSKDWMKGKASSFYQTERRQSEQREWFSIIAPLDRMLYIFKSNYHYNYCQLKNIEEKHSPTLEDLVTVPNKIRSLLEAYLGFIFPERGSLDDKLPKIIGCTETCKKVLKFANENSHAHSLTQATEIASYVVHAKQVIRDVLGAIQSHNPEHTASLEAELSK